MITARWTISSCLLTKCCFLAIRCDEKEKIVLRNDVIKNKKKFEYLASTITDCGNVTNDVKVEIKRNQRRLNQFFTLLSQNRNASLKVKEKVLESAVIYNCETWGDANLNDLEKKYRRALKCMLGVKTSTCNEFPYIELEKPTLKSMM